jgi:hypothetical protein
MTAAAVPVFTQEERRRLHRRRSIRNSWQIVERKARFTAQVMRGRIANRDTALFFAQVMALAFR